MAAMDDYSIPNSDDDKPHAVVFSYLYLGHITPSLILAVHLAAHRGFSVTFVLPEFGLHSTPDFDFLADLGLDLRCAAICDGLPVDFDRFSNMEAYGEAYLRDIPGRVDELMGRMRRPARGWVLVADSLHTWPAAIAEKYGMVYVSLWTASAAVFCLNYHLDRLVTENGRLLFTESNDEPITFIPGLQSITRTDLMSYIQDPNAIPMLFNIAFKAFQQVKNADFILCNTVQELEPETISALNQKQPTYAIGPINFFDTIPKQVIQKISLLHQPQSDCSQWLDSKVPASVLYISAGSTFQMATHKIMDMAHALLASDANFLWVLKVDDHDDVFPDGFVEDVKGRGLVVPWCNQGAVLSHPSVGGFLTHCGWNSVMESMWNEVPMICHPLFVDQPTNRKLVVSDWKIGLCHGEQVGRGEFGSEMDMLMRGGKVRDGLVEEAKKVKATMRSALEKDGSSRRNLERFLVDLETKMGAMRKEG